MRRGNRHCGRTIVLTIIGAIFGFSLTMCIRTLKSIPYNHDGLLGCVNGEVRIATTANVNNDPFTRTDVDKENSHRLRRSPARNALFVGIMTAQKYVETRAVGIYATWAQNLHANGSIAFFVSPTTVNSIPGVHLPLIHLDGVDDSYPPQRKSFFMLKYVYEHYSDQYEWFVRADDDVYLRLDKLEVFLRSLNSSQPLFIGQAGLGTPEEYGQLSLGENENYCMGGPGIILSRETLRRIGPHIDECLRSMLTTHEDVELGRCVKRFAGITCTWAYEMQTLFYNNQSGAAAYTGDLDVPEVHHSITMHPIKQPMSMRRLHNFIRGLKLSDLRFRSLQLSRDVLSSIKELEAIGAVVDENELAKVSDYASSPSLTKFIPQNHNELLAWEYLSPNIAFCIGAPNCPRHNVESYWRSASVSVIRQVMDIVNKYARQRGRVLEFQEVLYGYRRVDPIHGVDYVLDMLLLYKKFKGRRVTVPVRRHAYLQQSFGHLQLIEDDDLINQFKNKTFDHVISTSNSPSTDRTYVHIILPLSGRASTFVRFVDSFEKTCLKTGELVKLYVVLFTNGTHATDRVLIGDSIRRLQDSYAIHSNVGYGGIRLFEIEGEFNRGSALSYGVSQCPKDALLFFTDVDVTFTGDFIHRLRSNTVDGRRVYFPIVFSQYALAKKLHRPLDYTAENGYFRHFGYGLAGMYRSDFESVGGFDLSIRGWGMEDVELFDKFVKRTNVEIVRAADPDLVHVYHPITCDSQLARAQFEMCRGSKTASLASVYSLFDAFYNSTDFLSLFTMNGANYSMFTRILSRFL